MGPTYQYRDEWIDIYTPIYQADCVHTIYRTVSPKFMHIRRAWKADPYGVLWTLMMKNEREEWDREEL